MRAPVSVIIPTLNAAGSLPACLAALFEGLEAGIIREVVVSDGGSGDATLEIAAQAGAVVVCGAASRGGQLRRGAAAAAGEWLLFLHADTVLGAGWSRAVQVHMPSGRPAYFQLEFDAKGFAPRFVAAWANLRARLFALPFGDQGLLVSRADYEASGGFRDIPLMEDVALARVLGRRLQGLEINARTSAAKYETAGWVRRGLRNWLCLLRFFAGSDPERIAQAYRR